MRQLCQGDKQDAVSLKILFLLWFLWLTDGVWSLGQLSSRKTWLLLLLLLCSFTQRREISWESHPQAWGIWIPLYPVLASSLFMGMVYLLLIGPVAHGEPSPRALWGFSPVPCQQPWRHRESCWHQTCPLLTGDRAGDTQPPGDTNWARGSIPAGIQLNQGEIQPFTMEKLPRLVF